MRKGFSIFMAILVLMTGLHLSFASHFCCGRLAAVKISITAEKATCGMEGEAGSSLPSGKLFKTHCCVDELATLAVDTNYSPSNSTNIDLAPNSVQIFALPVAYTINGLALGQYSRPIFSPPGIFWTNSVDLTAICVFRI